MSRRSATASATTSRMGRLTGRLSLAGLALGLALGTPALAQDAEGAVAAGSEEARALPREGYTLDTVELTRWSDSDVVVKQLGKGERVEVVAEQGDHLRVRMGTTFGWVAAALVGDAPEGGEGTGAAGGLKLGGGLGGLSSPPVLAPPTGGAPASE